MPLSFPINSIPAAAFPLLAPSGSAPAPSYSFSAVSSLGIFHDNVSGGIGFSVAGIERAIISATTLQLFAGTNTFAITDDTARIVLGTGLDVNLYRDAGNTLAQRNGVNAQDFRLYNTFTDPVNHERLDISWSDVANTLIIATTNNGTGSIRPMIVGPFGLASLNFQTSGALRWRVDGASNGHFLAQTDNTNDIGAIAGNRPRNLFIAGALQIGSAQMLATTTAFTNNAAAAAGTLGNAPVAGNPTKWIPINDNGTIRNIPAW